MKGKKAIIFGVADEKSLAWAVAKKLNMQGVKIILGHQERNKASVVKLVDKLNDSYGFVCNIVDEKSLDLFFANVKEKFGKFDFLIHSIAFAKKEFLKGKFFNIDKKSFALSQDVSVFSLVNLCKRSYKIMNKKGSVIAMSHLGSTRVFENYNIMGVCKAALESSVRYLAKDMGDKKIRVNAISSGPIKTLAASGIIGFDKMIKMQKEKSLLKRENSADDIADASLFLCSSLSKNITGQTIFVDAGFNVVGN